MKVPEEVAQSPLYNGLQRAATEPDNGQQT
jgi:hypothetical protein